MWEVTTVAAGASVRELLWDSAVWGVRRGRKPASRCIGAMAMPGSHGCVNVCNKRVPLPAPAQFHFTPVPPLGLKVDAALKCNQQRLQI